MIPQSEEIYFSNEDVDLKIKHEPAVKSWLLHSIQEESKELGEISFIFCSDDFLHKMNVKYLDHNTLTDVITFDYCEQNVISGDIFISTDRITENAQEFKVNFEDELHRVMIHGIMHLCGYKDKSPQDQKLMSAKEDFYLSLRKFQ